MVVSREEKWYPTILRVICLFLKRKPRDSLIRKVLHQIYSDNEIRENYQFEINLENVT